MLWKLKPATEGVVHMPKEMEHKEENLLGAIARGTIDGGRLAFNVAIMLISFLALVALLDMVLAWIHGGAAHGTEGTSTPPP